MKVILAVMWNQLNDQHPVGLLAQLVKHCTGIRRGHGFKSRTGLNFFQALFSLLLKWCTFLRGSLSFTSLSAVEKYDFHIFLAV